MAESYQSQRNSFHVAWTATDIPRLAQELYEQTIPDVHLSLLTYWILEKEAHFVYAKRYIRELSLDQGYKVDRIRNLKLRKLLQDTYEVRPEWVAKDEENVDNSGSILPQPSQSEWLKHTLQHLEKTSPQQVSLNKSIEESLPRTPSRSIGGATIGQRRSVSSPLVARVDRLPESLRIQRQRLMEKAARSASLDCPESPTTIFPPNTPDRPAPLAYRSISSPHSYESPTQSMHNPFTTPTHKSRKPSETIGASTEFDTVIRKSCLSPQVQYVSTPKSPRARHMFTATLPQLPQLPSMGTLFNTIEEAITDDVFRIPDKHRSKKTYNFISTGNQHSQDSSNRLSDLDWQTTSSEEEKEKDPDNSSRSPNNPHPHSNITHHVSKIGREYSALIPDPHKYFQENSAFEEEQAPKANNKRHVQCRSQCSVLYSLNPEDKIKEDPEYQAKLQELLTTLSTHEDSSKEESILDSASESSEKGPRTTYTYVDSPLPRHTAPASPFTTRREQAIAETLAKLTGTPVNPSRHTQPDA